MSAQPTFDHDYALELDRKYPGQSRLWLAERVTEHEREIRGDPGYGPISSSAVGAMLTRKGRGPASRDKSTAARKHGVRTQPLNHLPPPHDGAVEIRRLRTMYNVAADEPGIKESDKRPALKLARHLRDRKEVIDIEPGGKVVIRAARPDELDGTGEIIFFLARYPGVSDEMWKAAGNARVRRVAAMQWLPPGTTPGIGPADLDL
jgi:hypothetical protein